MTSWIHGSFPDHEVNVVFARGVPLDAVTRGLRDRLREPLAAGQANGWAWAVHDMHNWEAEDYDDVDYGGMCPDGAEIVVFVTEPCSAKGFLPRSSTTGTAARSCGSASKTSSSAWARTRTTSPRSSWPPTS